MTGNGSIPAVEQHLGPGRALLILVVAVAVRALVWRDLADEILFVSPQLDAREALEWAQQVAHGNFVLPAYPTRGFLYPFFLGGLLAASGGSLALVHGVQLLVGAASALLAGGVAARHWSAHEGLATGLIVAVYAPFAFIDVFLWEETLFGFLLLFALGQLARPAPAVPRAALAGVLTGAAVWIRPTALAVMTAWAVAPALRRRRGEWPGAVVYALAGLLVAGAGIAAVSRAAGFVLPIRGYGGLNLWMGNDAAGGGVQSAPLGGAWDRLEAAPFRAGVRDLADYDAWFVRATWARAAADPAGAVRALASKAVWLLSAEEPRESQSFHYFRERSPTLRWLPGFGVFLGLAALGGWTAARGRGCPPMALLGALALALTVLATVVGFRYRLPVVALVSPLAGLGATGLTESLRKKRWRHAASLGLVLGSVVLAASLRRHPPSRQFAAEYAQAGLSHFESGDLAAAESAFRRAAAEDAGSALGPDGLGLVSSARGLFPEARAQFEEAIRRDPDFQRARLHSAELALREGRVGDARLALEASFAIGPRHLPTLRRLVPLLASAGDLERSAELARRVTEIAPESAEGWLVLARIEGARAAWEPAFAAVSRAQEAAPDSREARLLEGFLAISAQDSVRASRVAARLDASDESPAARLVRAGALALAGHRRAADRALRALIEERPGDAQARSLFLANATALGEREEAERFLRAP